VAEQRIPLDGLDDLIDTSTNPSGRARRRRLERCRDLVYLQSFGVMKNEGDVVRRAQSIEDPIEARDDRGVLPGDIVRPEITGTTGR